MSVTELREQAARAERLAWAVCDKVTTNRLLAMSRQYRQHADTIEAGCDPAARSVDWPSALNF